MEVFPISLDQKGLRRYRRVHGRVFGLHAPAWCEKSLRHRRRYGQLDWKLRSDERVAVMARTNARFMEPGWFAEPPEFASIDVSFISLDKILPPLYPCLAQGGQSLR
jgi:hypothetical protein